MPLSDIQRRQAARSRAQRRPLTRFEKQWVPLGLALGTCGLVISVLAVAHFLFRGARGEAAAALQRCARGFGVAAMLCCLACNLVDPGIPTADPADHAPADEADDAQRIRECQLPNGRTWKQKWCRDCRLWRPHRCGHCSMCERCVLRLDHHCGFMGTCVGERNFRFFAGFLFCAGMGIVCLLVLAVRYLTQLGCWSDFSVWYTTWEPVLIVFFFCCCPFPMFCPLLGALALTGASVSYTALMLADTDTSETSPFRGGKFSWDVGFAELRALLACRGARVYCLGPIALKAPCWSGGAVKDRERPSASREPAMATSTSRGRRSEPAEEASELEEQALL